jgi:hypothetical protein
MMAADAIQEPFAVINADDFYGAASYRALARHLQSGTPDYAMVGFILSKTLSDFGSVARGVCQVGAEGELTSIVELTSIERDGPGAKNTDPAGIITPLTGNELVSMNMWGFTPQVFPQLASQFQSFLEKSGAELKSECYLPSTVNALVAAGQAQVKVLSSKPTRGSASPTAKTAPASSPASVNSSSSGLYPESLWA